MNEYIYYHRRQHDASPRYRQENIINLELDGPEKTTQVSIYEIYLHLIE